MAGEGELKLNALHFSGTDYKKALAPGENNQNYFRQEDIFTEFKKHTRSTPEIDNAYIEITDADASKRDLQGHDIAGRPYNISGYKVMLNSPMYQKFIEINGDDFTEGLNDFGEKVMLYDQSKSDRKVTMFSEEVTPEGTTFYAIKDKDGNVFKFDEKGNAINLTNPL